MTRGVVRTIGLRGGMARWCWLLVALAARVNGQDTSPIVAEGIVEASLESVWEAWSTDRGLQSWLAPHASIDFRVGGAMRTNYDPAGTLGDSRTIENTILSFEPYRMLSIKVSRAPQDFPFPNAIHAMWTVMYFEPISPSRTSVRVVGLGFGADEESQRMRAFFERGNVATIEQLKRGFAANDPSIR